ncbi:MAG TPA: folylpolyglutamate synthase/dihydrofolate synthase family protein [Candidatus Margulisiibacteriota bacterium]|nr:folylpolyglutamate synthase/dihydrofolate synthase family protein [Candidatus Margulisiibacteriota bacterium]
MTYREAVQYLESLIDFEKIPAYPYKESLKLERIRLFLEKVSNPQDALRCIHVAGTKGKGSTCAFLSYILQAAGFKVGLYTSPHLSDFRERIRILSPRKARLREEFEGMIPLKEIVSLVARFKPYIEEYNRRCQYGPLTFFEVYTALALIYFKEQKVDFAVLETGLGGRLDATNVVSPLACAITPISYEHTQKLGNTLKEIATEKAGIIKGGSPIVISAPQEKEAEAAIKRRCRRVKAGFSQVGRDIKYIKNKGSFCVKTALAEYPDLKIRLLGEHQLVNATVAVGLAEALSYHNVRVKASSIREGLYNTLWPGRCEVVKRKPLVVLDGAQNLASAATLKKAIVDNFKYKKLIAVLGISNDKDIKGICAELAGLADIIILTMADNPRAAKPEAMAGYLKGNNLHFTYNVKKAKETAFSLANREDLILVCGSLFVVGEFRDALL